MFRWHKEIDRLVISPEMVVRLQRSLNRAQVALPGFAAQEVSAFLCAFRTSGGGRVAAVLHLHQSDRLAIYLNGEGEVPEQKLGSVFNEGIGFAESMGFMLSDVGIHRLPPGQKERLWSSLPLGGLPEPAGSPEIAAAAQEEAAPCESEKTPEAPAPSEDVEPLPLNEEHLPPTADEWTPPTLRSKRPPTADELARRRKRLRENLGRFLASL